MCPSNEYSIMLGVGPRGSSSARGPGGQGWGWGAEQGGQAHSRPAWHPECLESARIGPKVAGARPLVTPGGHLPHLCPGRRISGVPDTVPGSTWIPPEHTSHLSLQVGHRDPCGVGRGPFASTVVSPRRDLPRHDDEEIQPVPCVTQVTLLPEQPQGHHLDDHLHREKGENEGVKGLREEQSGESMEPLGSAQPTPLKPEPRHTEPRPSPPRCCSARTHTQRPHRAGTCPGSRS